MPRARRSVSRGIISGAFLLCALGIGVAPASAAFARRKVITIDGTRVPGTANHVDFPVLVSITGDANLKTTANGGSVSSAQGNDILFQGEDATTCAPAGSPCRLDHEIESYDGVAGTLVAWVRVPTLRYSGFGSNTVIYMYYGDATVTCSQQNKAGVWDAGYREVLHLGESGDHSDSTKNTFAAGSRGAVTDGVAGQVGRAVDLASGAAGLVPAHLNVSDGTLPTATSFTLETWVNFRSITAGQYIGFLSKGRECLNFDGDPDATVGSGFCESAPCGDWTGLYKLSDGSGHDVFSFEWAFGTVCKAAGMRDPRLAAAQVATGTWYHVAGAFDSASSTRRLLVNGTQVATDTVGACLEAAIPHFTRLGTDSNQDYLDGQMDEVRISFTARSNGWIQTGYNNQSSPATFYASVVDAGGPFAVSATVCAPQNPCAGGPGTCYLRSIGSIADYTTGSGTCTATNGSSVVSCPGATWRTDNRGRGDRITIDGVDYMVRAVDSETQLRLASLFAGATGIGNKSYTMSRQFATPQAWESCISSGGGACPYFPVANGNLVTGNRSEVGVIYKDASPYTGAAVPIVRFNGATTDASHTITLTADGVNRHYGIRGAGVVFDNGTTNTTRAVLIEDQFVTVEWLEVARGGSNGAHCIDFVPSDSANHAVIRNNIVRNCSGQGIRLAGSATAHIADINNNFIFRGAREGVRVNVSLGTGTGSLVRIFNNTFLRNAGGTNTEISTAENPNPYVVLRNNIILDPAQSPDVTWNGAALCTNAADCDWWNAASSNNVTGDAAPPTGQWRPDLGPNPHGGGLSAATEPTLSFVNATAGSEDLHLTMGSAAWNRGSELSGVVLGDIDATLRNAPWDAGADELPAAAAPPLIAYSDNAGSGTRPLQFTTFSGGAWQPGITGVTGSPPFHTQPLHQKVATTSPYGVRAAVWAEDNPASRDYLYASFWDGTSWDDGTGLPVGDAETGFLQPCWDGVLNLRCFDAAYEQLSGKLLVVYGVNALHGIRQRRYDGVWSAETATDVYSGLWGAPDSGRDGYFSFVRLAPRPGTNQIAFLGIEDEISQTPTYGAIEAAIWDGTSGTWGAKTVLSLPVTNGQNGHLTEAADIKFLLGGANVGDAIAVWGNGQRVYSARWSQAGGWTAGASIADLGAGNTVRWLRLAAKPQGDRMILAVEDTNRRIFTMPYVGTTRLWGALSAAHSTTAYGNAIYNRPFDVVWDPGVGADNVLLVYSDTTRMRYRISGDGGVFWSIEQSQDAFTARQAYWVQLVKDVNDTVHFAFQDATNALLTYIWSGGFWGIPAVQISNNAERDANHAVEPFAVATYAPVASGTTAVKLMSFAAAPGDGAVDLTWQTGSELDNLGFHLYRGPSADGPWTRLTSTLIPGLGSSPLGQAYVWHDGALVNGQRYYYRLEDVDTSSKSTFHGPVSAVPEAKTPPPPGGGGGGDGAPGDGSGAGGSTKTCPAWVLAAYESGSVDPAAVATPTCTKHGDPESVSFDVVSHDAASATLELRTGGFWALHVPEADRPAGASGLSEEVRVFVPGFDVPTEPRAAALPLRRALVEAVVGKKVRLVSAEAFDLRGFPGLRPAAIGAPEVAIGSDGTLRPARQRLAAPLLSRGYLPRDVALLSGTVFQGERKSAVVEIFPVRFDGARKQLVVAGRVRVKLAFSGSEDGETGTGSRGRVLPRQRALWREVLGEVHTSGRGLYALSFEALFPRSPRGFSTSSLQLQRQGESVPFHVEPAGSPVFGPGSVLYFFADRTASSADYSSEVAYQLVRSPARSSMGLSRGAPEGPGLTSPAIAVAFFERNLIYQPALLEAPDVWLWDAMASGVVRVKPFTLSGVDTASQQPAHLVVRLQGGSDAAETDEDHHVRVNVNGVDVGEAYFDGKQAHELLAAFSASLLREGSNELALVNVGDTGVSSLVFLDSFTVRYPQEASARGGTFEGTWEEGGTAEVGGLSGPAAVLEVTGAAPAGAVTTDVAGVPPVKWVTGYETTVSSVRFRAEAGHRYFVVTREGLLSPRVARVGLSTLREASNQADYLVIAPRELLAAAGPLLERRRSQGLVSRAVSFEEIASGFGKGQPSAEAIRDFLSFAYHSWQRPSPRYVVLLGDSTYDPRRFVSTSSASPLPALWTKTGYLWTVSDPALAAVNGNDLLPDLAIGRLPATTPEEAETLVGKLLAWEDSGQGLAGKAVLVADDPDAAGDFEAEVEEIRASYLSVRSSTTLRLRELGAATRPAILGAFDEGASLVSYVGHGGAAVWASENVLNSWDVPALRAQTEQPLLLTMNCLNGYFVATSFDALSEALVKAGGRGAIAAFSPSGLSVDGPAHQYHRAVMAEVTSGRHERLGDAILAAQRDYAETGLMPELLSVYQLLGDPGMRIQ